MNSDSFKAMAVRLYPYKKIILKRVTLLPHSRLYSLEPIGVGMPNVESLTSYISRLAYHHTLSVNKLFSFEIAPHFGKTYMLDPEGKPTGDACGRFAYQLHHLNGMGDVANCGVKAVQKLTLVESLCFLTMLPWRNVLASRSLLRNHNAWCPFCLHQWREEGKEPYQPLLWSLADVTVCTHHRCKLDTVCPHCSLQMKVLSGLSRPGYCSKCLRWIGIASGLDLSQLQTAEEDLNRQAAVAEGIGELLAAAPDLPFQPMKINSARALQRCVDHYADGTLAHFARYVGVDVVTINPWMRLSEYPRLPTLSTLMNVCQVIQIPVLSLLTDTIEFDDKQKSAASACVSRGLKSSIDKKIVKIHLEAALRHNPPPSLLSLGNELGCGSPKRLFPSLCEKIMKRRVEYKKKLEEQRYALLLRALKEYPPPPLTEVARRSKFRVETFRHNFPALCKKISRRYMLHRKKEYNERKEYVLREIRRVAAKLLRRDVYPSVASIKKNLTINATVPIRDFKNIVYDVQKELGLK